MTERGVQNILKRLVAKGAIEVTREGGNQVFKGAATVYQILTPPQPDKGDTHDPLQDVPKDEPPFTLQSDSSDPQRGDKSGDKGEQPYTKREQPYPGRVNLRSPHQVIDQVNKHHSAPEVAASLATQATARTPNDFDPDSPDIESIIEDLNDELGYLDTGEETMEKACSSAAATPPPSATQSTNNA
jgi:hypothetical protein